MAKSKKTTVESINVKEGINKLVKKLPSSLLKQKGFTKKDYIARTKKKKEKGVVVDKNKPKKKEYKEKNSLIKKDEKEEKSSKPYKNESGISKLKFRNFDGDIHEFKSLLDSNVEELGQYKTVNLRPKKIVVSFNNKKTKDRYLSFYSNYKYKNQALKVSELDYYEKVKSDYKHLRMYGVPEEYDEKSVEEGLKRRMSIEFKLKKENEGYKLTFNNVADCVKANSILNNTRIPLVKNKKENLVKVKTAMETFGESTRNRSRVFVRNLPFGTSSEEIFNFFKSHDKGVKVHTPTKSKGFAFVTFSTLEKSKKVINELNGTMFKKRRIQLSLSLPKKLYDPRRVEESEDSKEELVGDDESKLENEPSERLNKENKTSERLNNVNELGEMLDKHNEPAESETKESIKENEVLDDTIFIRNLDYNCTENELFEYFSKYGEVQSCKICVNDDKTSKGTAFVRFKSTQDVKKILEIEKMAVKRDEQLNSQKPTLGLGFTLRGRRLKVDEALAKDRAKEIKQHKDQEELQKYNERKNMHLLMVGVVTEESPEYKNLTPDQQDSVRRNLEKKMEKIKRSNTYVNPKRLCIKNLPGNVNSNDLREAIVKHLKETMDVGEYEGIRKLKNRGIVEVKLFKGDTYTKDSQGAKVKKKKPYAFVELVDHDIAMKTHQLFSNNSTLYHPKTLQCEFTIDTNFEKEPARKERKGRVKKKTYSRGKRQREKRRQQSVAKT